MAAKTKLFQQYAALPLAIRDGELQVLLITSRETRRWIIPKGWPEKTMAGHEVAAHEAFEEAGLIGTMTPEPFATYQYSKKIDDTRRKQCSVDVFLMAVDQELDDWQEKGERQREWMTPAEAAMRVVEAGLIELFLLLSSQSERIVADHLTPSFVVDSR